MRHDTMAASIRAARIRVVSSSLNTESRLDDDGDLPALLRLEAMAPGSLHEVEAVLDGDAESLIVHRDAAGGVLLRLWKQRGKPIARPARGNSIDGDFRVVGKAQLPLAR